MSYLASLIFSVFMIISHSAFAGTANHEKHAHHDHDSDMLIVKDVVIRATTPNAGATAAYGIIHNHSDIDDRLIGASVSFAKKVEIHEMKLEGDVMKMREIAGGLLIPAGQIITLAKGGDHVMIMGLSVPITMDGSYQISFEFEHAGTITVEADTISLSGKPATHNHNHDHNH